jgi:hypothetical protein
MRRHDELARHVRPGPARLITAHEKLRPETFERMWNALIDTGDPGIEILHACISRKTCAPFSPGPGPAPTGP